MMKVYACIKKAFIQGRLWQPEEDKKLIVSEDVILPKNCFVELEGEILQKPEIKEGLVLADIQKAKEKAETESLIGKMAKDDLIAKVLNKGLGKGQDLTRLTKKELSNIILEGVATPSNPVINASEFLK